MNYWPPNLSGPIWRFFGRFLNSKIFFWHSDSKLIFRYIEPKFQFTFEVNCMSYLWVFYISVWFWPNFEVFLAIFGGFFKFSYHTDSIWMFKNINTKSQFAFEVNSLGYKWVIDVSMWFWPNFEVFWPFLGDFLNFFVFLTQAECLKTLWPSSN